MVGDNIFYVDNWCVHTALSCRWRFPPSGWPETAESIHALKIMFKEYLAKDFKTYSNWLRGWHGGAVMRVHSLKNHHSLSPSWLFQTFFIQFQVGWCCTTRLTVQYLIFSLSLFTLIVQTIFNCQHGWKRTSTRSSFMRLHSLHSWKPRLSLSLSLSLSVSISVWFSRTILIVLSSTMETILLTTAGQRQLRQNWGKSGELKEQKNIVSSVAASSLLF